MQSNEYKANMIQIMKIRQMVTENLRELESEGGIAILANTIN